ncbi:MAG: hypothetical protein UY23_C0001G0414 [Candidatus Jorgensenbacteria bacterium GW2011_GWA1_48_11]|uniref:Sodium/calcium exchanger membrane region domain-containing protein n=1 Tax=Candidatus Jorgensenbacteria bacterium GW2011_GWA1_48_11 TaxID=1618660 RepID=A0A0G1WN81_9BACT|nr:MAG: hypothetical protein UY23_C0001G0414 [Candidatus Jorgensenbacteria bacterium GW2011_GWA1_48_11]KKW12299.1 MAG: hypothetical protein UY51_C0005G0541 [Candidatus Jorgensenbacteria bacterium GW2011_GWB1_49_9]
MTDFILLILSLFIVVKSAQFAVRYSSRIGRSFQITEYIIGFLVVAVISILPEAFISIISALKGVPEFGLSVLFGSNVADLALVFAIVVLASRHKGLRVQSSVLKESSFFLYLLALPIALGLNGYYSRLDGFILVSAGIFFYLRLLRNDHKFLAGNRGLRPPQNFSNFVFLLISLGVMLFGAYLTVRFGNSLARVIAINPAFIGLLFVGLSTTMPELFFSLRASRVRHDELALGDILGTVISDAVIVVGVMALIHPFDFNPRIVYVTGIFMLLAGLILFRFMKTGRLITKREGVALLAFYLIFIIVEYIFNH